MKINILTIFTMAAFQILAIQPANASIVDGNFLYRYCETDRSDAAYYQRNAYCIGYIIGAIDQMALSQEINGLPQCVPSNADSAQLRDVVVSYIQRNPRDRHVSAAALVSLAMLEAYGCQFAQRTQQ